MNAEFLAMTIVIVYVGAIAVLFLFVVMMLNIAESAIKEGFLKYFPFGLILIAIFISELFLVFNFDSFKIPENIKIDMNESSLLEESNTKLIGLYLYTDYFIIFQISGFILLLAMIGAIVLAQNDEKKLKSYSAITQKKVRKKESLFKNIPKLYSVIIQIEHAFKTLTRSKKVSIKDKLKFLASEDL